MKRSCKRQKSEWPIEVKVGSVTVKIYRSETRGRFLYTLAYRDMNRARVKKSFADLEKAKLEAQAAATKIQNGQIDVLELKSHDRVVYQHALRLLQATGRSLDLAAAEYTEARISSGAIQLYLAMGAFSGLRHSELMRLEWGETKLAQKHIEVTAGKAKTARRRIVPVHPNLRTWIAPQLQNTGAVFMGDPSRFLNRVTGVARELRIDWPQNGLRHSYASDRLAKCKSAAQVALEMGNSPGMVFRYDREIVTPRDATRWWQISPEIPANIIQPPPRLKTGKANPSLFATG